MSLGKIKSFVFARQASAIREFSARPTLQKQGFFILTRLNMAAESMLNSPLCPRGRGAGVSID